MATPLLSGLAAILLAIAISGCDTKPPRDPKKEFAERYGTARLDTSPDIERQNREKHVDEMVRREQVGMDMEAAKRATEAMEKVQAYSDRPMADPAEIARMLKEIVAKYPGTLESFRAVDWLEKLAADGKESPKKR